MRHRDRLLRRLCWLGLLLIACRGPSDRAEAEHQLERRILAPCCFRQTLEDHESEIAGQLRVEIHQRVEAGEPVAAIEADLVHRYGDEVRALPPGADPKWMIGTAGAAVVTLGLWVAVVWFRRRRRGVPVRSLGGLGSDEDARYRDQLDDELLELD